MSDKRETKHIVLTEPMGIGKQKTQQIKSPYYHPNRAREMKKSWMSPRTEKELDSDSYVEHCKGLYDLERDIKRAKPKWKVGNRTISDFIKKHKPSFPMQNHESIRKAIDTFETLKKRGLYEVAKKVREDLEKALENNPYLDKEEIKETLYEAEKKAVKEIIKGKIQRSNLKYPLGSDHTTKVTEGSKGYSKRVARRKVKEIKSWKKRKKRLYPKE